MIKFKEKTRRGNGIANHATVFLIWMHWFRGLCYFHARLLAATNVDQVKRDISFFLLFVMSGILIFIQRRDADFDENLIKKLKFEDMRLRTTENNQINLRCSDLKLSFEILRINFETSVDFRVPHNVYNI